MMHELDRLDGATIPEEMEDGEVERRLEEIRKVVRDTTKEAMVTTEFETTRELKHQTDENANPNDSDSVFLGMTLFGKETAQVEREVIKRLDQAEAELKDLVNQQREMDLDDDEKNDCQELEKYAEELTRQIDFLRQCSLARSYLDEATAQSDWLKSAQLVTESQTALDSAQEMFQREEKRSQLASRLEAAHSILESIHVPLRRKRVDLINRAEKLIASSVAVTSNSVQLKSSSEAYDVLETLGAPLNVIRGVADDLNKVIFQKLLDNHAKRVLSGSWAFQEETNKSERNIKTVTHLLAWKSLEHKEEELEPTQNCGEMRQVTQWDFTLKLIQQVMAFLEEHFLLQREELCDIVGQRLFGKSSSPDALNLEAFGLESNLLSHDSGMVMRRMLRIIQDTCIPSGPWTPGQLRQLSAMEAKLLASCQRFEQDMMQRHFIRDDRQLSEFCKNFERKYAEKRRVEILGEARDLLLYGDYHDTIEVGEEILPGPIDDVFGADDGMSIFKLHKSRISVTASRLYEMVRKTMDEAVESTMDLIAPNLYRTARELFDLFRAIIPAAHGTDVAAIPRSAAVFHNDCVFLAHQCLTLGLEYRERFIPASENDVRRQQLRQSCMFVDMVPPFRELAERSMGHMIEIQQRQLTDIVGSRIGLLGDALASNESLLEWTEAETVLKAAANHLMRLSQSWKPILSKEIYSGAMGHLVDTVFTLYLDRVLEANAISEPASRFVSALFGSALRSMAQFLESSRHWDRFTAVGRFMDMSLLDIQAALSEGVFRSVTGSELSRLIHATFDDSEKRRRLLHTLGADQDR